MYRADAPPTRRRSPAPNAGSAPWLLRRLYGNRVITRVTRTQRDRSTHRTTGSRASAPGEHDGHRVAPTEQTLSTSLFTPYSCDRSRAACAADAIVLPVGGAPSL